MAWIQEETSRDHGDEFSSYMKSVQFLDQLSDRQVLKMTVPHGTTHFTSDVLVHVQCSGLTLGMLSLVQTPSDSRRSRISHAKIEGHSLL